jgi:RNA polymerase sigma-70 factor (ECF subfamily)
VGVARGRGGVAGGGAGALGDCRAVVMSASVAGVVAGLELLEPARSLVAAGLTSGVASLSGLNLAAAQLTAAARRALDKGVDPAEAVWPDLVLVEAVLQQVPGAWEHLRRLHGQRVGAAFQRVASGAATADDIEGHFWSALVVPTQGDTPLLARYFGRGALGAWLVVTATRLAQKSRDRNKEDSGGDAALLERVAVVEDELKLFRNRHRPDFVAALKAAFSTLDPKSRNLLRHHYLDGVETPGLGRMYGVHRATALRWLEEAREQFVQIFRDELGRRFSVPRIEVDSIARLFRSNLDLSMPLEWSDGGGRRER